MKQRNLLSLMGTVVLTVILGLTTSAVPVGAKGNSSATGHIDLAPGILPDQYSFSAIQRKDGTVRGRAEILLQPEGERFHVAIDTLEINENVACISGIITRTQVPSELGEPVFFVGERIDFYVVDNGEGANALPDEGSSVFTGDCSEVDETRPSPTGNVQVRP